MSDNEESTPGTARRGELIADGIVHAAGLIFAAWIAIITIVNPRGGAYRDIGLVLYVVGLVSTFLFSALHNLIEWRAWNGVFRRLDHAAIFLMIAGTYSPFTLASIADPRSRAMFVFVWAAAITGVAAKLFFPTRLDRFSVVAYLLLGWCILANPTLLRTMPMATVVLLAAGGILYSSGVIFHLWTRLQYQNAIWHAFVLAGAGCHYAAIARYVTVA